MTEDDTEFCPTQILDVTKLCYCSYCFKATENYKSNGLTFANTVHIKDKSEVCAIGEAAESFPDYWPLSWSRVKCLDFKFNRCHFRGCRLRSEKMCQVARHIAAKHTHKTSVEQDSSEQVQVIQDQNVGEPSSATEIVQGNQSTGKAEICSSEDHEQKRTAESDEQTASTSQQMVVKTGPLEELESIAAISEDSCGTNEMGENSAVINDTNDFPSDPLEDTVMMGVDNQHKCDEPENKDLRFRETNIKLSPPSVTLKLEIKKENIEIIKSEMHAHDENLKSGPTCSEGKFRLHSQFRCGFCHFQTINILTIKIHYLRNHKTKIMFICEPCYFVSHNKYTFLNHWKANHQKDDNPPKPVNISLEIESLDESTLNDASDDRSADSSKTAAQDLGLVTHTVENYNTYLLSKAKVNLKCGFCTFETVFLQALKCHTASLHYTGVSETIVSMPDNTKTYRCVTCSAINTTPKTAAFHYIGKHTQVPAARCELCELDLRDYHGLYSHMKAESHQEYYRRSLRCSNCQFVSLSKKALQKHTGAVHKAPPVGKFTCDKCKFVTDHMSALTQHTRKVHSYDKGDDGMYHCKECDFKTSNKGKLSYHLRCAPDHIYAKSCVRCDICNFAAANEVGLSYHKKMKHGASSSSILINN